MSIGNPDNPMLRKQIRHAWVSGQYGSLEDLSQAFSIPIDMLKVWRSEEGWDDEKELVDLLIQKRTRNDAADKITRLNRQHDKIWSAFDHQIYLYMREATSQGKMLNPKVMDLLSKIFERSQKGRRTARGADVYMQIRQQNAQEKIEIVYSGLEHAIAAAQKKMKDTGEDEALVNLRDVSIPITAKDVDENPERLIADIQKEDREAVERAKAQKKPKKKSPS
jgi:hypothetical protein